MVLHLDSIEPLFESRLRTTVLDEIFIMTGYIYIHILIYLQWIFKTCSNLFFTEKTTPENNGITFNDVSTTVSNDDEAISSEKVFWIF